MLPRSHGTLLAAAGLAMAAILASGCGRKGNTVSNKQTRVATRVVSFKHEIQPIFSKRCIACHAPGAYEDGTAMGALVLSEGKSASQLIDFKSIESPLPRV